MSYSTPSEEQIIRGVEILGQLTHEWLREKQASRLRLGRRWSRKDGGRRLGQPYRVADCSALPTETYVAGQS